MMNIPRIGSMAIRHKIKPEDWADFRIEVVRDAAEFQKVVAIRAAAFMMEQECPYEEEYDGNDFCAMHLLAYSGNQPIGTLRLRWFAGFGKVERVCVLKPYRGSPVIKVLLAHAFEIAAQKGYRMMIAQIQARLWPVWSRMLHCSLRTDRAEFSFSDYDYKEIDIPLPAHPAAVGPRSHPLMIIRPEGAWDREGVLEERATEPSAEPERITRAA